MGEISDRLNTWGIFNVIMKNWMKKVSWARAMPALLHANVCDRLKTAYW